MLILNFHILKTNKHQRYIYSKHSFEILLMKECGMKSRNINSCETFYSNAISLLIVRWIRFKWKIITDRLLRQHMVIESIMQSAINVSFCNASTSRVTMLQFHVSVRSVLGVVTINDGLNDGEWPLSSHIQTEQMIVFVLLLSNHCSFPFSMAQKEGTNKPHIECTRLHSAVRKMKYILLGASLRCAPRSSHFLIIHFKRHCWKQLS